MGPVRAVGGMGSFDKYRLSRLQRQFPYAASPVRKDQRHVSGQQKEQFWAVMALKFTTVGDACLGWAVDPHTPMSRISAQHLPPLAGDGLKQNIDWRLGKTWRSRLDEPHEVTPSCGTRPRWP